ncbi:MAG: methyltransferase domain-containing protein [Streptosporangiaceae bacterium]|nr:methyltransferase domain-containing protein [Streptosporangiaceae bacterium]
MSGPAGHTSVARPGGPDAAAQALALRLFRSMLATQESFTAYLGVKLGLYEALREGGPATVAQLAARVGLAPRYVREWLEQQAAAGLVAVDDPGGEWQLRRYRLPPGHDRVLTRSADPMSLVWTAMLPLGGVAAALPSLLAAFRTGDGVPADTFGDDWRHGHGGANRAVYTYQLAGWMRRYLPDLHRRLSSGLRRIADVGCGAGWASIALARAYPAAQITAVDTDGAVVEQARLNAAEAGVDGRVSFRVAGLEDMAGDGGYDLVCLLDTLHELALPVVALRVCRTLCGPAGAVLVMESRVAGTFRAPADEIERFQYATSVLHCLPAGLVGAGAVGTGTVMRPAALRACALEAGFTTVRDYDVDDRFHQLYRLDQ